MLLSFVLDAGKHNHGMDELAKLYLGQETIKFSDVAGSGAKQVSFDKVPIDKARDYAAEDADVTMQLWAQFKPRLAREHMVGVYETIERPLIPVLLGMEQAGIKVDAPQLASSRPSSRSAWLELEQRAPQARRPRVQCRLAQAAGRDPVRRAEAARRPAQQERLVGDRRSDARGPRRAGPCAAGQDPGAPPDRQAQGHLHRRAGARARRQDRPHPHLLPDDRRGDRPARLDRSQPAEHPGAHRGRPQDPPGLHRRAGPQAPVAPTTRRSSSGCWRTSPTSPRSRRPSRAATTSTPSPRARCSACRSRAWTRWCAGAPRRSTSASSTASRPSASPTSSASASRRRASTSPSTSSAIPASATTWRRPRSTRASTAT